MEVMCAEGGEHGSGRRMGERAEGERCAGWSTPGRRRPVPSWCTCPPQPPPRSRAASPPTA
eukprot:6669625-Prymnesium_polylepis.1